MFDLIRPFRELRGFDREADRFFRNFMGRSPWWDESGELTVAEPNINVYEDDQNVVVEAQVPGLKKEDLQLNLTSNRLTLRGETKRESEKKERNYHLREMRYGSFERSIPLPSEVASEKASAELKDGLLRVTLPKSEAAKKRVRQIEVKVA